MCRSAWLEGALLEISLLVVVLREMVAHLDLLAFLEETVHELLGLRGSVLLAGGRTGAVYALAVCLVEKSFDHFDLLRIVWLAARYVPVLLFDTVFRQPVETLQLLVGLGAVLSKMSGLLDTAFHRAVKGLAAAVRLQLTEVVVHTKGIVEVRSRS